MLLSSRNATVLLLATIAATQVRSFLPVVFQYHPKTNVPCRGPWPNSALRSSTADKKRNSNGGDSSAAKQPQHGVVYQKVVRPPPGLPDLLFLGHLVEYLQGKFELPERLPMIYEKQLQESSSFDDRDNNEGTQASNDRYNVVCWDSPLSPSADKTCLNVQVVGIFTNDNTDSEKENDKPKNSVPNMAMVVVDKKSAKLTTSKSNFPPMLQGLFADSETKILRALDRGLDDFMAGKVKFDENRLSSDDSSPFGSVQHQKDAEEAILAEIMPEEEERPKYQPPKDLIEALNYLVVPTEALSRRSLSSEIELPCHWYCSYRSTITHRGLFSKIVLPLFVTFVPKHYSPAAASCLQKLN
jgi:hypothetical protein